MSQSQLRTSPNKVLTERPLQPMKPVQLIVASSESEQVQRLQARNQMLEGFCKELMDTNKVLDMENRLCITQLMNIFSKEKGGTAQLNNFISALQMVRSNSNLK